MRLQLTLKVDKLSTPHSNTASLPTGTVSLRMGPVNLGISATTTDYNSSAGGRTRCRDIQLY